MAVRGRFNCLLKMFILTKVTDNWPNAVDLIKSIFIQTPIDFVESFVPGEGFYNVAWHSCPTLTWENAKELVTVIMLFSLAK